MHGWIVAVLRLLGMGGGGAVAPSDPEIIDLFAFDTSETNLIAYDTSVTDLFAFDTSITDLKAEE